jgi:heme exporter protein C
VLDKSNALSASKIEIEQGHKLALSFTIPDFLPTAENTGVFSLVIDAPELGSFVLPASIYIRQDTVNIDQASEFWTVDNFQDLNKYEGFAIPFRNILKETLRNTYFHVSLWFSMFILYFVSMIYSIKYLRNKDYDTDHIASSLVEVGTLFGILGLITGAIWAKNTWGTYWTTDVKLNMAAISMMIYTAYLILRSSINDDDRKAVIASSYNIFAFFVIIPLIFVIPRLTDSLHPGNGGNPGFGGDDMDNTMRMVFYPAIIAFTLIGLWMTQLIIRTKRIKSNLTEI